MKREIYKPVINFENYYEISNYGNIKTFCNKKKEFLKHFITNGYHRVSLKANNKAKMMLVHRLVAIHFIENLNNFPEINHIDGNKSNNYIDNLEWCTRVYNNKHAKNTGLILKGENHGRAIMNDDSVKELVQFFKDGIPVDYLLKKYNIKKSTLTGIITGTNWKHLNLGISNRTVTYRINIETIEKVQQLLSQNLTVREISRLTGVMRITINKIKNNEYKNFQSCIRQHFSN